MSETKLFKALSALYKAEREHASDSEYGLVHFLNYVKPLDANSTYSTETIIMERLNTAKSLKRPQAPAKPKKSQEEGVAPRSSNHVGFKDVPAVPISSAAQSESLRSNIPVRDRSNSKSGKEISHSSVVENPKLPGVRGHSGSKSGGDLDSSLKLPVGSKKKGSSAESVGKAGDATQKPNGNGNISNPKQSFFQAIDPIESTKKLVAIQPTSIGSSPSQVGRPRNFSLSSRNTTTPETSGSPPKPLTVIREPGNPAQGSLSSNQKSSPITPPRKSSNPPLPSAVVKKTQPMTKGISKAALPPMPVASSSKQDDQTAKLSKPASKVSGKTHKQPVGKSAGPTEAELKKEEMLEKVKNFLADQYKFLITEYAKIPQSDAEKSIHYAQWQPRLRSCRDIMEELFNVVNWQMESSKVLVVFHPSKLSDVLLNIYALSVLYKDETRQNKYEIAIADACCKFLEENKELLKQIGGDFSPISSSNIKPPTVMAQTSLSSGPSASSFSANLTLSESVKNLLNDEYTKLDLVRKMSFSNYPGGGFREETKTKKNKRCLSKLMALFNNIQWQSQNKHVVFDDTKLPDVLFRMKIFAVALRGSNDSEIEKNVAISFDKFLQDHKEQIKNKKHKDKQRNKVVRFA